MDTYTDQHFEAPLGPIFDRRTANEWLAEAAGAPEPKRLLGGLWREGELAILFGAQGLGKSVLATQIADAVSVGRGFGPFETEAAGQNVVYLDLKLTPKQFAMRYNGEQPGEYHRFDDNFQRMHANLDAELPKGCRRVIDHLIRATGQLIEETGAKVLIVDNITHLMRSNDVVRDVLPLMRELNRLKRLRGVSVLVVAQSKKLFRSRHIAIEDLQCARILGNFADTIFAIGDGGRGGAERYIKHLKSRSGEVLYDHNLVPTFRIESADDGFLGFVYEKCISERAMYGDRRDDRDWETIDRIKQLYDDGRSIREIAVELETSKTTAHRLLQMWKEPRPKPAFRSSEPAENAYDFPGREVFDRALAHERFNTVYESDDEEDHRLRREYNLIDNARAYARSIYLASGVAPSLEESIKGYEIERQAREARRRPDLDSSGAEPEKPDIPAKSESEMTAEERFLAKLTHGLNGYGRDIWIEIADERGKPVVWYAYNSAKALQRYDRSSGSVQIERFNVEEITGSEQ